MRPFTQSFTLLTTLGAAAVSAGTVSVFKHDPPTRSGPLSIYNTRAKYGIPITPELSAAVSRAGFDVEKLDKRQQQQQGSAPARPYRNDTEWLNQVQVGTPPQNLTVQLDTGSAEFWVFADTHPTAKQAGRGVYSPSNSSTAALIPGITWSKGYVGGDSASGDAVYNDTVRVGDLVSQSQTILPATAASASYVNSSYDGILGLDLADYTATLPIEFKGPPNFFEAIKPSLPAPLFGVDLKQDKESFFDFGVIPPNRYRGDVGWTAINRFRVKDMDFTRWNMTVSAYSIGNVQTAPLKTRNMTGVADTGTTLMYLDKPVVQEYYSQVPGSRYDSTSAGWVFPCDGGPMPDFSFGVGPMESATVITVPGIYLNWTVNDQAKRECFGGLQEAINFQGASISLFGTVAMKAAYVIFEDRRPDADPRIGWAVKDL
ncbi:endothiapepsin [Pyricularia oryzae 70-15]|uniref:Endothiapepsin n=3 Tax=Pyricularia oryzae TaxID=318829 RepID=G4MP93_PYRO7|nr:endothiapepsin [Pyricularia oryzae 70-15]EHA56352.1 endothiapepsin [Pyricularia oryzae 70-15]ELQ33436.1 endothiapepsin [Pyricularia oryzae Y34]KAI7910328.1 endothiapepsin [Pyricularia oryzae]KAI7910721.1 endothiapepsin [Pyricularia oryzae]